MAASKKQKIFFALFLIALGFLIRPIRSKYKSNDGSIGNGSDVTRTGLFSVTTIYTGSTQWNGKLGLFGSTIDWVRPSDGAKATWTAV